MFTRKKLLMTMLGAYEISVGLYLCIKQMYLILLLRCARIGKLGAGVTETFSCSGMTGRYVNIVIPGRREYLSLAEVEVYGQKQPAINYGRC